MQDVLVLEGKTRVPFDNILVKNDAAIDALVFVPAWGGFSSK